MNRLIADGYRNLLALSTCTGIDRYNRDDRMVALPDIKYVNDSEHFHIAMDELNDVEIRSRLLRTDHPGRACIPLLSP